MSKARSDPNSLLMRQLASAGETSTDINLFNMLNYMPPEIQKKIYEEKRKLHRQKRKDHKETSQLDLHSRIMNEDPKINEYVSNFWTLNNENQALQRFQQAPNINKVFRVYYETHDGKQYDFDTSRLEESMRENPMLSERLDFISNIGSFLQTPSEQLENYSEHLDAEPREDFSEWDDYQDALEDMEDNIVHMPSFTQGGTVRTGILEHMGKGKFRVTADSIDASIQQQKSLLDSTLQNIYDIHDDYFPIDKKIMEREMPNMERDEHSGSARAMGLEGGIEPIE
tara:strand:- start:1476 stop:2327 length:852 start_codon:yes stop_codon:yes gene_type:complete